MNPAEGVPAAASARPPRAPHADAWALRPDLVFLNHGSFGACPRAVLAVQADLRTELEANPVAFLGRALEARLDQARARLADFLGSDPADLAFVPNATAGVASVLRSLRFSPGDEVVTTDHEYNAALNMARFAAARDGARVVVARIPLLTTGPDEVAERILGVVGPRTRLVLVSHVTSPTALIFPVERLVATLEGRGIPVLVDGAHGPGMLPLDLSALGASFYAGNLHKWVCAPKGAAFLHVRRDRQAAIRPLAISHGANDPRPGRTTFRKEFDWTGTADPTPLLAVPAAIDAVGGMVAGGWATVMGRNRDLAALARRTLAPVAGAPVLAPETMLGSMAAIEVPLHAWPRDPVPGERRRRLLRVSAHLHNDAGEYRHLAEALRVLLADRL